MKTVAALLLVASIASASPVETCFVPGQDCTSVVAREIAAAKSTVLVQAYGFTSKPIEQALIDASKRGVKVEVILDRSNLEQKWSGMGLLVAAKVPTSIDSTHAISHNKIVIVDGAVVVTGSFNFTASAQKRNAENVVVLRNAAVAASYTANWKVHRGHAVVQ
jgi:phosphatidylserine/phosphatidylglycerophosphate/cardiolipin synthase-like enzyme